MDREEIVADLLAGYTQELTALTDAEIRQHWLLQNNVRQMSDEEWRTVMSMAKTKPKKKPK